MQNFQKREVIQRMFKIDKFSINNFPEGNTCYRKHLRWRIFSENLREGR